MLKKAVDLKVFLQYGRNVIAIVRIMFRLEFVQIVWVWLREHKDGRILA